MSSDYQSGRVALGARMRELRTEAGLNGKDFAERLGWQRSMVSRLENGKQTPSRDDLAAWAEAAGRADVIAELAGRLAGLETRYRSLRKEYSNGHRARRARPGRDGADEAAARRRSDPHPRALPDTRVRAGRVHRERRLPRRPGRGHRGRRARPHAPPAGPVRAERTFRVLLWEGALYALNAPRPVMAAQLDRLRSMVGMDTVQLGIIPFAAELRRSPSHGFWIYDRRLVIVETLSTEMWLDDDESITLYERAWYWLAESAVYDATAHRLIGRASAALNLS